MMMDPLSSWQPAYRTSGEPFTGQSILIADDDPILLTVLGNFLVKKGIHVISAGRGKEALELLERYNTSISLFIFSWTLPDIPGDTILKQTRPHPDTQSLVRMIMCSKENREAIMEALESGADDFITKPFEKTEIWIKVVYALRLRSLAQYIKEYDQMMIRLALKDTVTGLINRSAFNSLLETETARCMRFSVPMSVVLIRVLNLDEIYGRLGTKGGDQLLREITHRVVQYFRKMDSAGKLGPDLIGVLLPETRFEVCGSIMERVVQRLSTEPFQIDDDPVTINVCAGATGGIPSDQNESRWFIRLASEALSESVKAGINTWSTRPFRLIRPE